MGIDVAHLIFEATSDADDQVVDEGADGSEGGNGLTGTMVDLDGEQALLGHSEGDGDVGEVLDKFACYGFGGFSPNWLEVLVSFHDSLRDILSSKHPHKRMCRNCGQLTYLVVPRR